MRRIEMKICRECKTMYRWESGGIIMNPQEHKDMGLCEKCRTKGKLRPIEKIFNMKGRISKRRSS